MNRYISLRGLLAGGWLLLLLGSIAAAATESDNPHVWEPTTDSVAVFKNGIGFFVRTGEVQLRDGWCVSGPVPPALFGTFAIYALDEGYSVDIVGAGSGEQVEFDGRDAPSDEASKRARLKSCLGLNVQLTYKQNEKVHSSAGKLERVAGDYVILDSEGQLSAVPVVALNRLQILDYPLRIHVKGAPPNGKVKLGMAYLRKGITWIPEYTLSVLDDETAQLTLRATLVNDVEELVKASVSFVVGVPSFVHADKLTPLAIGQAIRAAGTVVAGFDSQVMSNAIMSRNDMSSDRLANEGIVGGRGVFQADSMLSNMTTAGESLSDFTVYSIERLTLRQGEKAMVMLFSQTAPYRHHYKWESPLPLRHYLRLRNDTPTAWTTGPVIATRDQRPLCQDTIKYTARGNEYDLPVTTAVNISTQAEESEIDRELKAHEPAHRVYLDKVIIEGKLTLRNFDQQAVKLDVRRDVPGLVLSSSDDGQAAQNVHELRLTERHGSVSWQLELKGGEKRELTYRYERFVASK
jgi:hypothetical protein